MKDIKSSPNASLLAKPLPALPPVFRPQSAAVQRFAAVAVPPVFSPAANRAPIQAKLAAGCGCGCSGQPKAPPSLDVAIQLSRRGKAKKPKKVKLTPVERSWRNLMCYSPDKANSVAKKHLNDYMTVMQAFLTYYSDGIRGHCSDGGGSTQNAQTTKDLGIFNGWYAREYK